MEREQESRRWVVRTPIREAVKLSTEQAESVRELLEAARQALESMEAVSVALPAARALVGLEKAYGSVVHSMREHIATCALLPERR